MKNKNGFAQIIIILMLMIVVSVGVFLLLSSGVLTNLLSPKKTADLTPSVANRSIATPTPNNADESGYENPFGSDASASASLATIFDPYQNPFNDLK